MAKLPPCGNYGDVDGDGYVTHIEGEPCDSTLVARYVYFGWDGIKDETSLTTEEEFIKRADVNGDGKVSMVDAMLIAQYVEGIIDTFPVCEAPPAPFGDITKVELDGKLLPEGGTLNWVRNDEASVKVFFKNTGNAAGTFTITTKYNGTIIRRISTVSVPADGAERYVDGGSFTPDTTGSHTVTVEITP